MKTAATIIQVLIRLVGLIMIVLGLLFWIGNALALIPVHMLLGITLVLLLWTQGCWPRALARVPAWLRWGCCGA